MLKHTLRKKLMAWLVEDRRREQVAKGESVDGLYPIGPKWRPAYEAWLKENA